MARWQRFARLGLGLFALAFAVVLWFATGTRTTAPPVVPIERLDPAATSEIRGGDVLQHKGTTRDIKVEFGSQMNYADGRSHFTTFKAHVDDRGGRSFLISGAKASVGPELSTYDLEGDVTLQTSDGLTVTTPRASFTEAEGIVRGDGPVKFRRARTSGSGVGFTYDRSLDRLALLNQAVITVAPAADGGGAMAVTAGAAHYSRAERFMRFERAMRMERTGQVIESADATVFLLRDRDEPQQVELRGGSRITGGTGTGSLQGMQAQDINLRYGADGRTLEQAILSRQAGIALGQAGQPGQQLQADLIETELAADGSVTRLIARTGVRVTLPAVGERTARTIAAPALDATGEAGRGLTNMSFEGGVAYQEAEGGGRPARTARARSLVASMAADGAIDEAVFTGGFRFEDGRLLATSADATYQVTKGALSLRGATNGPTRPHVADERVTVDGNSVDVTLSPREMRASGAVKTELAPGRRQPGERGTSLLNEKEIVVINAESLVFNDAAGRGEYTGQAHLYQASGTSIRADSITLDEKQGHLSAVGSVRSALPVAGSETGKGMSIARAGELTFDDAKRLVVFTKQATLDGIQGNLTANRIELLLSPKDNSLERLEAQTDVKVILDKREATGQRMTYHPSDERYVLTGSPVRLVQECQESTGRTLTFYKASDKVQVDGNEEIRVQTKGGKCPGTDPR
jgi:lipopolysaccharide export system protein LptA/lipopolysaccharide export system protein LptC